MPGVIDHMQDSNALTKDGTAVISYDGIAIIN